MRWERNARRRLILEPCPDRQRWAEQYEAERQIGRPHGYTSATFAYDANAADAKRRRDYISGIDDAAPVLGTEYLTVEDTTLLRGTGELKPSVNRAYVAIFKATLSK